MQADYQPTQVACYSGQTYAERPVSFYWEGLEYKVQKVEKQWLEPEERHFIVRTEEGKLFALRYQEQSDRWSAFEIVEL